MGADDGVQAPAAEDADPGLVGGSRHRRRGGGRRWVYVTAGCAVVLLVASLLVVRFIRSPQQIRADTAPPPRTVLTAAVEYRVLSQTLVFRGDVVAKQEVSFTPAAVLGASRLVVSAAPIAAEGPVAAGAVVVAVSGRPVIALPGAVPAYRDLKAGDTGPDVTQLQQALSAVGLSVPATGTVDPATVAAVAALYRRVGFVAPATLDTHQVVVPADEVVFVSGLPGTLLQGPMVGETVQAPLVRISSGELSVRASVDPDMARVLRAGTPVQVISEILGGQETGTVSSVTAASAGAGQGQTGGSAGSPGTSLSAMTVTVTTAKPLPQQWNGQNVRITATAAKTAAAVLVVPGSAVTTHPDGSTSVTVIAGGQSRPVTVTPGLTADGYVEITPTAPGSLRAGDQVQVGLT